MISILLAFATTNVCAQNLLKEKITIDVTDASAPAVLNLIEQQANINFAYIEGTLKAEKKVTYKFINQPLAIILDRICADSQTSFELVDNQIIFYKLNPKQLILITGTVADALNQPLPGTEVKLKDGNLVTYADDKGYFTMRVPQTSKTLVFNKSGYTGQEINITGPSLLVLIHLTPLKN